MFRRGFAPKHDTPPEPRLPKAKPDSPAHTSVQDFLIVLSAIHLSSYVQSPFKDRGGIFIVGPPGILKSTMVDFLDDIFPDAIVLSDVNAQALTKLKERISGGSIRTLAMSEVGKIYERHSSVAANIEGTLRALAGEGFRSASYEDQTISRLRARATIVGGMTGSLRERHASRWDDTGFARRFLWSLVALKDPGQLERAVVDGELIEIAQHEAPRVPVSGVIPDKTTREERVAIANWCKYQPTPNNMQIALLVKSWAVLKWWATKTRKSTASAWQPFQRFAKSLGKDGVEIEIR